MAAPTLVSRVHTTPCDPGFSSGPFISGSFNAVAGNLIVVLAAQDSYTSRPINTCTDTAGNTYTLAGYVATTGTRAIACWYCLSSVAKTGNVVTLTNTGGSLSEKGCAVLQFNASSGTWSYVGGAGYTAGAYNGTSTTGALNMTGAGVVAEFGTGDEDQTTSTWNFSAGCSNYYGSSSTPDDTGEGSGVVGADLLSAASPSHTFTATFANTHSLLGQWGFVAAGGSSSTGTLNVTLDNATASAAGTVATHGSLASTLGAAVLAAAAAVGIAGTCSTTLGNATSSAAGAVQTHGTLAQTLAPATLAGAGSVRATGALNATLAPATLAAVGSAPAHGSLSATLANATLIAAGRVISGIVGNLDVTLEDAHAAGAGTVKLTGSLGVTLGNAGLSAAGTAPVSGALAQTLGTAVLVATGTASSGIHGSLNATLGNATLASGARIHVAGIGSITLANASTVSVGTVALVGQLNSTLAPATLSATGRNGSSYPADGRYYAALGLRPFYVSANARNFYVMANPNITPLLDTKDPRESVVVTLDGSNDLADGETLTDVTETDVTVVGGIDAEQSLVVGTPAINGAPVTFMLPNGQSVTVGAGKGVQAEVSVGLTNCRYLIAVTCITSNPDKVLTLKGILPVSAS